MGQGTRKDRGCSAKHRRARAKRDRQKACRQGAFASRHAGWYRRRSSRIAAPISNNEKARVRSFLTDRVAPVGLSRVMGDMVQRISRFGRRSVPPWRSAPACHVLLARIFPPTMGLRTGVCDYTRVMRSGFMSSFSSTTVGLGRVRGGIE